MLQPPNRYSMGVPKKVGNPIAVYHHLPQKKSVLVQIKTWHRHPIRPFLAMFSSKVNCPIRTSTVRITWPMPSNKNPVTLQYKSFSNKKKHDPILHLVFSCRNYMKWPHTPMIYNYPHCSLPSGKLTIRELENHHPELVNQVFLWAIFNSELLNYQAG